MKAKRLGRPPDTTSDETRERVLAAARDCFGRYGYAKTTNKDIASAAGITTGAIYHYFDSKQRLFAAVTAEVNEVVFGEFERAAGEHEHLIDKLRALLDAASSLHRNDRTLARFSATFPIELARHPELAAELPPSDLARGTAFFRRLADEAEARGELPDGLAPEDVANMIVSVTMGLAYFGALVDSTAVHRGAVVALERVLTDGLGAAVRAPD